MEDQPARVLCSERFGRDWVLVGSSIELSGRAERLRVQRAERRRRFTGGTAHSDPQGVGGRIGDAGPLRSSGTDEDQARPRISNLHRNVLRSRVQVFSGFREK